MKIGNIRRRLFQCEKVANFPTYFIFFWCISPAQVSASVIATNWRHVWARSQGSSDYYWQSSGVPSCLWLVWSLIAVGASGESREIASMGGFLARGTDKLTAHKATRSIT